MDPKWYKGNEKTIEAVRIDVFPARSCEQYASMLRDDFTAEQYALEFLPDDTILVSNGPPNLPDLIQIHLTPDLAAAFFKYLLYSYAGKKVIDGFIHVFTKISESVASEFGKDIYSNIKSVLKKVFSHHLHTLKRYPNDTVYAQIRGYYDKAILILRIHPRDYPGLTSHFDLEYVSADVLRFYGSKVLPLIMEIIAIIGSENVICEALAYKERGDYGWRIMLTKSKDSNDPDKSFFIQLCLDAQGQCMRWTSGFTDERDRGFIPPEVISGLKKFEKEAMALAKSQEGDPFL